LRAEELQKIADEAIRGLAGRGDLREHDLDEVLASLPDVVKQYVTVHADLAYDHLLRRTRPRIREIRAIARGFEKRLYRRWKRGLDLLEVYLLLASEVGDLFNDTYRPEAARTDDYVFEALIRLQARAVQVGREVLTLLRGGFADGAHARWRTAHEVAVVANFLRSKGPETARRYLEHEVVESYKAMVQYDEYADRLQCEHYPAEERAQLAAMRDSLCTRYGQEFEGDYGWAAEALSRRRPRFSDIEKASGLGHLRPYYRMASHNVHAGAKGIMFHLGVADGADVVLAGPSNWGLASPADGVARSVLQATIALLVTRPDVDNLTTAEIMMRYVHDIGETFLQAHQQLEADEYRDA